MGEQSLPRCERLRSSLIPAVFEKGGVGKSRWVLARALPNDLSYNRIAVIAGKSFGGAVIRNRIRRRLRAAYRILKKDLSRGWDVVFIARAGAAEVDFPALVHSVQEAFQRVTGTPPRSSPPADPLP